jgi:hypothetical protein
MDESGAHLPQVPRQGAAALSKRNIPQLSAALCRLQQGNGERPRNLKGASSDCILRSSATVSRRIFPRLFSRCICTTIPIPRELPNGSCFSGNAWIFYSLSPAGNAGRIGRCCSEMADQRRTIYILTVRLDSTPERTSKTFTSAHS